MAGSFYVLAMVAVLRIWVQFDLIDKFGWLAQCIPYLNWALIIAFGIFVIFTILALIGKILGGGARRRYEE